MGLFDIMDDMMKADYQAQRIAEEIHGRQVMASIPRSLPKKETFDGGRVGFLDRLFNTKRYQKQMEFERCMRLCKEADSEYRGAVFFTEKYSRPHIKELQAIREIKDPYEKAKRYEACTKQFGGRLWDTQAPRL